MDVANNDGIGYPANVAEARRCLAAHNIYSDYQASERGPVCSTRLECVDFGSVRVFLHGGYGSRHAFRRLDHIRTDHADDFLIALPVDGWKTFSQCGTELKIEPGHFAVLPTSRPFSLSIAPDSNDCKFLEYTAVVSGALLRACDPGIDKHCDEVFKIDLGAGTIMASLFEMALSHGKALSEQQARNFGKILVEAIANSTHRDPALQDLSAKSLTDSNARIREKAEYFIASMLSNPTLRCQQVAQHCKVSTRYLNKIFSPTSKTVSEFIRNARLDRCRDALLSRELDDRNIFEVALDWGFNDPAHFSRIYKDRFGKSPREDRRLNKR